jgi:F-type H+-transporting ATPase subunit b
LREVAVTLSKLFSCLALAAACAFIAVRPSRAADEAVPAAKTSADAPEPPSGAKSGGGSPAQEFEPGQPEKVGGVQEVKTDLAIWTFVVFLVLLAILWKFAWGPIVAGLAKREQRIADNIAAAERANEQAKLVLAEYEQKLTAAADQVRAIMEDARKEAEQVKLGIVAEAKEASKAEFERSKRELQRATDAAVKELSEKASNLAVDLAGKIVKVQLSHADHARLVQEAMAEFAASGPSVN